MVERGLLLAHCPGVLGQFPECCLFVDILDSRMPRECESSWLSN